MIPDAAMMLPIDRLRRFMAECGGAAPGEAFAADGVVIVENFPPFLFTGQDAVARWAAGFREHARASGLAQLSAGFGAAQDFRREADRVFFTLPTEWTGLAQGVGFAETGGWAFVLVETAEGWRLLGYAWAVVSRS